MAPVYPVKVIVVELPVHKVAAVAVAVPPTEVGLTVIVTVCAVPVQLPVVEVGITV